MEVTPFQTLPRPGATQPRPGPRDVVEQPGRVPGRLDVRPTVELVPSETDQVVHQDAPQWHGPGHLDGATVVILRRRPGDLSGNTSDLTGPDFWPEGATSYPSVTPFEGV